MKRIRTWSDYLTDLDKLYKKAVRDDDTSLALKIKEAQIKIHQNEMKDLQQLDVKSWSVTQLDQMIDHLEQKIRDTQDDTTDQADPTYGQIRIK